MPTVSTTVEQSLEAIGRNTPLCIGLSGGLDSVVLLHCLKSLDNPANLRALHVNHNLDEVSSSWQHSCESLCASLEVELTVINVDVKARLKGKTAGIELAARQARYEAFSDHLKPDEALLLAHHRDDQMETMLMRLMRGAGVQGMSAIPSIRLLGSTSLLRPLLDLGREELLAYAQLNGLTWVTDPSNADTGFDRNFCRHEILPVIESRWPGYRRSWSKSQQLFEEAHTILLELAANDLEDCMDASSGALSLAKLQLLSESRLKNLLRYWLSELGLPEIGWNMLGDLVLKLRGKQLESATLIEQKDYQMAVSGGALHVLNPLPQAELPRDTWCLAKDENFILPGNGQLRVAVDENCSVARQGLEQVRIRYRQEGDRCKLMGRPAKSLKKLFQEKPLAPWVRERIPLLCRDDEIVYIPGFGATAAFTELQKHGEEGFTVIWHSPQFNCSLKAKSD